MSTDITTDATPGLSQMERVSSVFLAPTKTFNDIRDKNRSWWMPYLIAMVFAYIFFTLVSVKVGWQQVGDTILSSDARAQERLAQAPPEAKEQAQKMTVAITEGVAWGSAVVVLLGALIASLVLWATVNFVFGGKSTFAEIFSVWLYAGLPGIFKLILGSVMVLISVPDSFNLKNFAPTNVGFFLPADANKFLMVIATKLDIADIWGLVLLSIGLAIVARVKRSTGYMVVFGWWFVLLFFALIGAAFSG